ncbi:hypothetical protein Dimus_014956 [Dionaea muscipula]
MAATVFLTNPHPSSLFPRRTHYSFPRMTPTITKQLHLLSSFAIPTLESTTSVFQGHRISFRTITIPFSSTKSSTDGFLDKSDEGLVLLTDFEENPAKTIFWVLFWASVSLTFFAFSKDAEAAAASAVSDSIRASSFGLKVASALRRSGWPDEAVVFALATLPVIELRGAIPVGYWMQMKPTLLTVLSLLGNMLPVPFIILYLKKLAKFLAGENRPAARVVEVLFERAKQKAGPVEEFQWLGLMLFVAVPLPGTGAWTGAIIASVLDMPFWSGVSANFFGVVLAGLLVNLLVNLGFKYAILTAIVLFIASSCMWSVLRSLRKCLSSTN